MAVGDCFLDVDGRRATACHTDRDGAGGGVAAGVEGGEGDGVVAEFETGSGGWILGGGDELAVVGGGAVEQVGQFSAAGWIGG